MTADTRSAIDTTRELITDAVRVGLRQWAALGIDGKTGVTLEDFLAACIAEALAEHERMVREQVAREIEAAERALAETDPATAESSHRIAARCAGLLEAAQIARGGAPTVWSDAIPPGGRVCAAPMPDLPDGICGMPVESEPCPDHGGGS